MFEHISQNPIVYIFVAVVSLVVMEIFRRRTRGDAVPRPKGLPLVGDLFKVAFGGLDRNLLVWRKRFGDVFKLNLGDLTTVFVFGKDNIDKVLVNSAGSCSRRPTWLYIPQNVIGDRGLIWNNGESWTQTRKQVQHCQTERSCLENLGEQLLAEVTSLTKKVQETKQLDVFSLFDDVSFNVISSFIFGKRYEYDDKDVNLLQTLLSEITVINKCQNLENMYPRLAGLKKRKHQAGKELEAKLMDIFKTRILSVCTETNGNIKCFADTMKTSGEDQFLRTVIDLYIYGYEMTSSMFLWHIAYFAKYPEWQTKCRDEINSVIQDSTYVSGNQIESLHVCRAFFAEVMRVHGPGIVTAPHANTDTLHLGGVDVPPESIIVCDLRDPRQGQQWEEPLRFNPGRFLDDDEKFLSNLAKDVSYTFGMGPRSCPAQTMVGEAQGIILLNLVKNCVISQYVTHPVVLQPVYKGVSLRPMKFEVQFEKV